MLDQTLIPYQRVFKKTRFQQIFFLLALTAIFLGLIIVPIESQGSTSESHPVMIKSFFDGIWWAVTTMTTVGYGDYVPVTVVGRIIGMILEIIGVVMFGLLIGTFTIYFNRSQDEFNWHRLFNRLEKIHQDLEEIKKHSKYLVKTGHDKEPD